MVLTVALEDVRTAFSRRFYDYRYDVWALAGDSFVALWKPSPSGHRGMWRVLAAILIVLLVVTPTLDVLVNKHRLGSTIAFACSFFIWGILMRGIESEQRRVERAGQQPTSRLVRFGVFASFGLFLVAFMALASVRWWGEMLPTGGVRNVVRGIFTGVGFMTALELGPIAVAGILACTGGAPLYEKSQTLFDDIRNAMTQPTTSSSVP